MQLHIESRMDRGLAFLRLGGELLRGPACEQLLDQAAISLCAHPKGLVLILDDISRLDDPGLNALVSVCALANNSGVRFGIVDPRESVRGCLETHQLTQTFMCFDSEAEAVACMEGVEQPRVALLSHRPKRVPVQSSGKSSGDPAGPIDKTSPHLHDALPRVTEPHPRTPAVIPPDLSVLRPSRYIGPEAVLTVTDPTWGIRPISVTKTPFFMGRGGDNDLLLLDVRISRDCAALWFVDDSFQLEDRGNLCGLFVNGEKVQKQALKDGDTIDFGLEDGCSIVFHRRAGEETLDRVVSRIDEGLGLEPRMRALKQLSLILEASALMQSKLPQDEILKVVVDRSIEITGADRGVLYNVDPGGGLWPVMARARGACSLNPQSVEIARPVRMSLDRALRERRSICETKTLPGVVREGDSRQHAVSGLTWSCIPLFSPPAYQLTAGASETGSTDLLGLLYLDSSRVLDFCGADCQILDSLSVQAASVLASIRLVQKEQERRAMEHELDVAHKIQQALRPRGTGLCPHVQLAGISRPCTAVGGDFYDFLNLGCERTAFVIADVSGHGLGAALLSTMLQGNFSAMALEPEPSSFFYNTNRFICEHTELGRYATLFFGILDRDGALQYINAGHWPPLLIRSAGAEPVCAAGSIPLGLLPDSEFPAHRYLLQPSDTLVLFTDGIVEARDASGNEYGIARLRDVALRHHKASAQELADAVLESLEQFARGKSHEDDITLAIIRYIGPS